MDVTDISRIILNMLDAVETQRYYLTSRKYKVERRKKEKEYQQLSHSTPEHSFAAAVDYKDLKWIAYFRNRVKNSKVGRLIAAASGDMDLIAYFGALTIEAIGVLAEYGHMDIIQRLVESEKKTDEADEPAILRPLNMYNITVSILSGGVIGNRMDVIEYALSLGVSPDYGLNEAIMCNNAEMVRYFIEKGAADKYEAIDYVISSVVLNPYPGRKIDPEIVLCLFAMFGNHEDINFASGRLACAAAINRMDLVAKYIDRSDYRIAFVISGAIISGNIKMVEFFVEKIMDEDYEIYVDIDLAECLGYYEIADYFRSAGFLQIGTTRRLHEYYNVNGRTMSRCTRIRFISECNSAMSDEFIYV